MRPWASCSSAMAQSRVPMSIRRATHWTLRPRRPATAPAVRPSSFTSEQITRASSKAVSVRAGELATSRRHLWSTVDPGASRTTGMS